MIIFNNDLPSGYNLSVIWLRLNAQVRHQYKNEYLALLSTEVKPLIREQEYTLI